MSEKYTDIKDVVRAVLEKYKGVKKLSKSEEDNCFYSHTKNGVGCAFSCLLSAEEGELLDDVAYGVPIRRAFDDNLKVAELVREHFDLTQVDIDDLRAMQQAHDHSGTVTDFRRKLRHFLKMVEWDLRFSEHKVKVSSGL